jgi:hypothetical protein
MPITLAKRAKATIENVGEHREDHKKDTKARRAEAMFVAISFPFPNSDWFFR